MSYWNSHVVSLTKKKIFFSLNLILSFNRYLELFLGQFYRCGNITLWGQIAPSMKGIGIASFLIVTTVTLYYTTIIGKNKFIYFE